jgi:hypothetical protein
VVSTLADVGFLFLTFGCVRIIILVHGRAQF